MQKSSEINQRNKLSLWLLNNPKINPYNNLFKMYTSCFRLMPDVIICGFHKTSTTSLHHYLIQHPNIIKPTRKEIGYFSTFFWRGEMWYKSHFPTKFSKIRKASNNETFLTLDSDPGCSYHPNSPKRVHDRLPNVKLIFVLRNPIDRAWSEYNQDLRRGWDPNISFEDKIKDDDILFENMIDKLKNLKRLGHEKYVLPLAHISIGKYIIHIENWLKYFPMEQFLFLTTDEINSNLNLALKKIYEFLQIPERNIPNLKRQNVGNYPKMDNYTRLKLIEYYKPYNKKLEELLNRELNWDK